MEARGLNDATMENVMGERMSDLRFAGLFMAPLLFVILFGSSLGMAQTYTVYDGPGFDASYPEEHMLFLKGDDDTQFLDRNWTTLTGLPAGSVTFSKTSSLSTPTIIEAQTTKVRESLRFEGNISVQLFASLETSSNICSITNIVAGTPVGSETQFTITLSMGGVESAGHFLRVQSA